LEASSCLTCFPAGLSGQCLHFIPLKGANDAISITQVKALYKDSASKPLHLELKETIASWLDIIRSCNTFSNLPD